MRGIFRAGVAVLLAAALGLCFVGCDGKKIADEHNGKDIQKNTYAELDYSAVNVSEYVKAIKYKDLEVLLDAEDSSKESALWSAMLETVEMSGYPESAVNYYFEQTRALYMSAAGNVEEDYLLLLESRGLDEEDMINEARELVKEDLVVLYITQTEQISVSEAEKEQLFGMYVDKYVSTYGYDRAYVTENMTDLIYESMLYDKMMEYLIINNTFTLKQ